MAQANFEGPEDVLSGNTGFLKMMSAGYNINTLLRNKTNPYCIEQVYFKPYASCRHTHPAIEAVLKLRIMNEISPGEIKEIRVITYKGVIGKHDGKQIYSEASAKMSIPYSVAVSLVTGCAGIHEFILPYIHNETVLELAKKVNVYSYDEFSDLVPHKRVAHVEIETYKGSVLCERVDYPKGEPENPFLHHELIDKFFTLWSFAGRKKESGEKIIEALWSENLDLGEVTQLLGE
jgi:2-methylcitrate dehydratase PrpD